MAFIENSFSFLPRAFCGCLTAVVRSEFALEACGKGAGPFSINLAILERLGGVYLVETRLRDALVNAIR